MELVLVDLRDHGLLNRSENCVLIREVRVKVVHILTGYLLRENEREK